MTPGAAQRQRAEAVATELFDSPATSHAVTIIITALAQARREALEEAAKVAERLRIEAQREDLSGGYTADLIVRELNRLAREGG